MLTSACATCVIIACHAAAFENLAGMDAARQLGQALPGTLEPIVQAVRAASENLPALATIRPGAGNPERLTELQQVRHCSTAPWSLSPLISRNMDKHRGGSC